jgi:RNA polymerase sigma-70 factor (ECF subfamily)
MDEADDDRHLLSRMTRGDRDAFAALYRRRRPDVYRFALHMRGSPARAEDIVQDVFLAVIHEAERYAPERATVLAWLLGIARNHVKRALHRDRRIVSLDAEESASIERLASGGDPLSELEHRRDIALVHRALLTLPVRYREVVVLCDLRELSYGDAAAALKCAVGTVRSRLHRGRTLLARRLRGGEIPVLDAPIAKLLI